ncbi:MAG: hypothetical protein K6E87_01700 [bacterium]|nr:hypothetical protein [bacterium]
MLIWRILFLVACFIFVTTIIMLNAFKFRKNHYFREYQKQEFLSDKIEAGIKNEFYLTDMETAKYIKRYAIRKSKYDKAIICNYTKPFKYISFFVVCYNKKKKVVNVLEIVEKNTNQSSKIINLSSNTDSVNIYIKKAEDVELNTNVISTISVSNIKRFSFVSAFTLFSFLFMIRHLAIECLRDKALVYMESLWNYISILAIFAISILYFFIMLFFMKRRNSKNRNGGALEYEFY